jgi:hypothetical protein
MAPGTGCPLAVIDENDALAFLQSRGYGCAILSDAADTSGLFSLSLAALNPSLTWLCVAGFCFFASKLYAHERKSKRQ